MKYTRIESKTKDGIWWCNAHEREATHIDELGRHWCDPALPGIACVCDVVFAEIEINFHQSNEQAR